MRAKSYLTDDDEEDFDHIYLEVYVSDIFWKYIPNNKTHTKESEELLNQIDKIHNQLLVTLYNYVENSLTSHQKEILSLRIQGKTYYEIAKILGINYTAVYYAACGMWRQGKIARTLQGGYMKKLISHATSGECMELRNKIKELRKEYSESIDNLYQDDYET